MRSHEHEHDEAGFGLAALAIAIAPPLDATAQAAAAAKGRSYLESWLATFPALDQRVGGKPLVYLDAEIVWTRGTTEGINLVATAWGRSQLRRGSRSLKSHLERAGVLSAPDDSPTSRLVRRNGSHRTAPSDWRSGAS